MSGGPAASVAVDPRDLSDPEEVLAALLDPRRRGALYPWYHRLRALEPVHATEALAPGRAWVVTRYADVRAVLRHPRACSDRRTVALFDVGPEGADFFRVMAKMMLYLDPPDHDRVRRLVRRPFTPRAVERLRARVQREVDRLLDRLEDAGSGDLVADFAYPLPIVVICELMDIPQSEVPRFLGWAHAFARRGDVAAIDAEVIRRGEEAARGFRELFLALARERRRRPGDDLLSALLAGERDGGRLDDDELVSGCTILLQAGHETTADLIALALRGLLLHPDQLALLRAEPGRIVAATEELLRWDSSVQLSQRVAACELELSGTRIPAGEPCILVNGAANRDPAVYADPDRLDLARAGEPHLAFGLGRHRCLGASLARVEAQTAIASVVRRFPKLALAGEPVFRGSLYLRGLASLPLRW